MGFCFACFGAATEQRREEERLESLDARAKAAEAADKRQEQFEKSAAGRAMRAQLAANAKQTVSSNNSEPVLKFVELIDGAKCPYHEGLGYTERYAISLLRMETLPSKLKKQLDWLTISFDDTLFNAYFDYGKPGTQPKKQKQKAGN